jgi:hypothetical protein
MPALETQPAAELLKAFSHPTRLELVDYAQDGVLRCYYLCRPRLVRDMLSLVQRDEPPVKRTAEEIQADKKRLANALAQKGRGKSTARSKVSR